SGYFLIVQDNSTVPSASDPRWQPVSGGYQIDDMATLSNPVNPTFYAWVRDEAGNITNQFSKTVQVGQLWTETSGILPNFSAFDDNETIGIAFSTSSSTVPGILLRNLTDNSTVGGNWNRRTDNNSIIDFDNSSLITAGNPYQIEVPAFTDNGNVYAAVTLRFNTISGDGSSANPYGLQSREDLSAMRIYSNKVFEVKTDIDLAGMDWEPLGRQQPFQGTLRGDNHTISNLLINAPNDNYSGLFGKVENAIIQDLQLDNVTINSLKNEVIGSLAGDLKNTTVRNVQSRNVTILGGPRTGGLIGRISGATSKIDNSSVVQGSIQADCTSYLTAGFNVGGLVGAIP
ncbi:MAG: ZmpA/ZmpB/ZmpC family metallo-endopeptidase-related protein, partial [bacterium]